MARSYSPSVPCSLQAETAKADLPKPPGKHYRIVFREGRDLNIFGVKDVNVDGQALRYTDHRDRLYIVYPAQVNYMEVKIV